MESAWTRIQKSTPSGHTLQILVKISYLMQPNVLYDPHKLRSPVYAVADLPTVRDFQPKFPVFSLPDATC